MVRKLTREFYLFNMQYREYFVRYDKIYAARPSFFLSLKISNHLSNMYTFREYGHISLKLQHDLDLAYTSSLGLKRAHFYHDYD